MKGVFSGHVHMPTQAVYDGIPYYTLQSAVEKEPTQERTAESHAILRLRGEDLSVHFVGHCSTRHV